MQRIVLENVMYRLDLAFGLFIEITSGWPVGQMRTETRVSTGIPYQIESGRVINYPRRHIRRNPSQDLCADLTTSRLRLGQNSDDTQSSENTMQIAHKSPRYRHNKFDKVPRNSVAAGI
eukprot:COSAG02_NODE_3531_length_6606_cov_67.718611_2_plen_119_part_00